MKTHNPYARPARGSEVLKFQAPPRSRIDRRLLLLAASILAGCGVVGVAVLIARQF